MPDTGPEISSYMQKQIDAVAALQRGDLKEVELPEQEDNPMSEIVEKISEATGIAKEDVEKAVTEVSDAVAKGAQALKDLSTVIKVQGTYQNAYGRDAMLDVYLLDALEYWQSEGNMKEGITATDAFVRCVVAGLAFNRVSKRDQFHSWAYDFMCSLEIQA